jgi:hypothetical protein
MAIKACAPERSDLLWNREEMQMVRESLDEGYCDVTGRTALTASPHYSLSLLINKGSKRCSLPRSLGNM